MTVYDLNREQLAELKQNYLIEVAESEGDSVDYATLSRADDIISDERIYELYADTTFVPEDFSSSAEEYQFSTELSGTPDYIAEQLRLIASDIENGYYGGFAGGYGASWGLDRI